MPVVTLDDLKAHANITFSTDDTLLTAKIAAAQGIVEGFIGVALDDATEFPDGTPAPLIEAVLKVAADLYENREASLVGASAEMLPLGVRDLCDPYRKWCF